MNHIPHSSGAPRARRLHQSRISPVACTQKCDQLARTHPRDVTVCPTEPAVGIWQRGQRGQVICTLGHLNVMFAHLTNCQAHVHVFERCAEGQGCAHLPGVLLTIDLRGGHRVLRSRGFLQEVMTMCCAEWPHICRLSGWGHDPLQRTKACLCTLKMLARPTARARVRPPRNPCAGDAHLSALRHINISVAFTCVTRQLHGLANVVLRA